MELTFKKCWYKRKIIVAIFFLIALFFSFVAQMKTYSINYKYFSINYQLMFLTPIIFIVILFLMCEKSKLFWGLNIALCVSFAALVYAWPTPFIYSEKDFIISVAYITGYSILAFVLFNLINIIKLKEISSFFKLIKYFNVICMAMYILKPIQINTNRVSYWFGFFVSGLCGILNLIVIIITPIYFAFYIYLTYKNREKKKLLKK